jgi:nicotinamidase-related amidase
MKALLVVDIQKGLTLKNDLYNETLFYETVNKSIFHFRETNNPVIFVQHNNKFLIHNDHDWEIDDRVDWSMLDLTIQKAHADSFRNTSLKTMLEERGIKQVYVCGLATHSCIKHTCIGCLDSGFECFLIKNAHTCWKKDAPEVIFQIETILKGIGTKITDL